MQKSLLVISDLSEREIRWFDKQFAELDNDRLKARIRNYKDQLLILEANIAKCRRFTPRGVELWIVPRNQIKDLVRQIETELEMRNNS